jgi:hypothetical protein
MENQAKHLVVVVVVVEKARTGSGGNGKINITWTYPLSTTSTVSPICATNRANILIQQPQNYSTTTYNLTGGKYRNRKYGSNECDHGGIRKFYTLPNSGISP